MSLSQKPFSLPQFLNDLGVIPFEYVRGEDFDLLKAATVQPRSGSVAKIEPMHAGFSASFFSNLKSADGEKDLEELLNSVDVYPQDPGIGVSESTNATSGRIGLSLASLVQASASGSAATAAETRYSLTDVKIHSLEGSPLLTDFLEKHLPTFVAKTAKLCYFFAKQPTVWSGSIDMVLAIVTTKATGKAEIYRETAQAKAGELKVPAADPTGGGSVAVGLRQSSSQKDQQGERGGVIGASFCLVHLHKSVSSGGKVEVVNPTIVKNAHDPAFTAFCRSIKLKKFRKLVTGQNLASLGFLTEKKSEMGSHQDLESHLRAAKAKPPESLAAGGWDDNVGVVNLEITAGTNMVALDSSARLPDGLDLLKFYQGSMNLIFSASRIVLSKMYQDLKERKPVGVAGMRVKAMSPAFKVDVSKYLPICFLGKSEEEDDEIPGAVVRDFDDFVFIFPVEGHDTKQGCATVYSDWEVRESIVRVGENENNKISALEEAGFHAIQFESGRDIRDHIFLGRHQLARVGDPWDGEPADGEPSDRGLDIFRARGPADASVVVAGASSVPTLLSATDGKPSKKRKL